MLLLTENIVIITKIEIFHSLLLIMILSHFFSLHVVITAVAAPALCVCVYLIFVLCVVCLFGCVCVCVLHHCIVCIYINLAFVCMPGVCIYVHTLKN